MTHTSHDVFLSYGPKALFIVAPTSLDSYNMHPKITRH